MSDPVRAVTDADTGLPTGYRDAPWGTYAPTAVQRALIGLARGTFLHRGRMRHRMTSLIAGMGSPLDVIFRDCRYRIEGRNNLMEYGMLLHPGYNAEEIDFLAAGCRSDGVAVDIGSNIGLYSLSLGRAVGPQGRVICIDANAGVLARLEVNARLSDLAQVQPVHSAVGDHEGRIDLGIRKDDLSIVTVQERDGGSIPMRPLAAILADAGVERVDVLKIDIEGYEDKALAPYLRHATGDMVPRRIVIERGGPDGGDYVGCAAEFARLGLRLAGRTRSNSLYECS
jgi:FkbM family methyltransferase